MVDSRRKVGHFHCQLSTAYRLLLIAYLSEYN